MFGKLKRYSASGPDASVEVDCYTRGTALYQQGQYEQAAELLAVAGHRADLVGQMSRYYQGMSYRAMGIENLRAGHFDSAQTQFKLAIGLLGKQAELRGYLASVYARSGRHDDCAAEIERIVAGAEGSVANWRRLAQAQWRAGRRAQAYMTIQQALRRLGPEAQLHLQLGMFYAAEELMGLARQSLARAAEADCTCVEAHYCLALVQAACWEPLAAARSLQRALHLRPLDVTIAYQLSLAARAAQEAGEALVVQLPDTSPGPANATQSELLARFVARESDFVEAFLALPPSAVDGELFEVLNDVIQMALAEHDGYADLHLSRARVLERLGKTDAAMEYAKRAIELNARYVKAIVFLAQLHSRAGQIEQAAGLLQRAIDSGADWPDMHCLAGEWMIAARHPDKARSHLERALELKPNYSRAADALASLAA